MSLKNTAQETLAILKAGKYTNKSGEVVEFLAAQQMAVKRTILYTPKQSYELLEKPAVGISARSPQIEVTAETTQAAANRLVKTEGCQDLVLLSFASACFDRVVFAIYTSSSNSETLKAFQIRFQIDKLAIE
jgi:uncharacterized protein (TIGR02452 family)